MSRTPSPLRAGPVTSREPVHSIENQQVDQDIILLFIPLPLGPPLPGRGGNVSLGVPPKTPAGALPLHPIHQAGAITRLTTAKPVMSRGAGAVTRITAAEPAISRRPEAITLLKTTGPIVSHRGGARATNQSKQGPICPARETYRDNYYVNTSHRTPSGPHIVNIIVIVRTC